VPIRAEARGFHPHMPLGEAAAGAANIKHVFDSRYCFLGCQLAFHGRFYAQSHECRPKWPCSASFVALSGETLGVAAKTGRRTGLRK
jgi:hypothetical protein